MEICQTPRLVIRQFQKSDADYVLRQLNEPSWLVNIGDRGIRSLADAEHFIESRLQAHFQEHGFGFYVLIDKSSNQSIGMCGLIQRDFLPTPDLGYALLESHWNQGYAYEAATAILQYAEMALGLPDLYAMTIPTNEASIRLLGKLGFRMADPAYLTPDGEVLNLFVRQ
ncbi:MAG: GNAT family N-acetyltransferase [Pirellulaceae bacterium]|nr:GNAT family N-acetyltransferase [Pirellulaceae bacterium]